MLVHTFMRKQFTLLVILRSSIIYGSESEMSIDRTLFLQWAMGVIEKERKKCDSSDLNRENHSAIAFYEDEFRSPTYVKDLLRVIDLIVQHETKRKFLTTSKSNDEMDDLCGTYNIGGPVKLSRAEMVLMIAKHKQYDTSLVKISKAPVR